MKSDLENYLRSAENNHQALNWMREYLQARVLLALQKTGAMIPLAFQGGTALRFPVTLKSGETVILKQTGGCTVTGQGETAKSISPSGRLPALKPGRNSAQLKCDGTLANQVGVTIVRR